MSLHQLFYLLLMGEITTPAPVKKCLFSENALALWDLDLQQVPILLQTVNFFPIESTEPDLDIDVEIGLAKEGYWKI